MRRPLPSKSIFLFNQFLKTAVTENNRKKVQKSVLREIFKEIINKGEILRKVCKNLYEKPYKSF